MPEPLEVERYELTAGPLYHFDLDRRDFLYEPGDQEVVDRTEVFLKCLDGKK